MMKMQNFTNRFSIAHWIFSFIYQWNTTYVVCKKALKKLKHTHTNHKETNKQIKSLEGVN